MGSSASKSAASTPGHTTSCACWDRLATQPLSTQSRPYYLDMSILPKMPTINGRVEKPDWEVRLSVRVKDIACLMREGFNWTPANISMDGWVQDWKAHWTWPERCRLPSSDQLPHWSKLRHYTISGAGQDPEWTGCLLVFGRSIQAVSQFDTSILSVDNPDLYVRETQVTTESHTTVYCYRSWAPGDNFNTVCENVTMGGWWPWPRNQARSGEERVDTKR